MDLSKVAILCPIWKRRQLVQLVLAHYRHLQALYGFHFIASVSEPDFPSEWLTGWATSVEAPNLPIGSKINTLARAAKNIGCAHAIIIGSDDFISRDVFEWYAALEPEPKTVYGFKSIHFYRVEDDLLTYWSLHDRIGLGRVLPLDILDSSAIIWPNKLNKGLDNGSLQTYLAHGYSYHSVLSQDTNGILLDVKYSDNISSDTIVDSGAPEDVELLYEFFPANLIDCIRNLPLPVKKN